MSGTSSSRVKEILWHCQCRRFVLGDTVNACTCHECGRVHVPGPEYRISHEQPAR